MYFDFYEDQPDFFLIARDMQRVEGNLHLILAILLAALLNITAVILLVVLPYLLPVDANARSAAEEAAIARAQQQQESSRFVFIAPRVEAPPPPAVSPRADLSDRDRLAQAPERAKDPTNPLPFSRGNTFERVDAPGNDAGRMTRNEPPPAGRQPPADRAGQGGENGDSRQPGGASMLPLPGSAAGAARPGDGGAAAGASGPLSEALRDLGRYTRSEVYENRGGGGGQYGPAIQFDSKGVDFGPWLRRFIAQIKRNWNIPYAAMAFRGHVVITFNVHRDGQITDLGMPGPSSVDGFNQAAYGALVSSNPTEPLPREYPADRCFFTVTFYYNEQPPLQP